MEEPIKGIVIVNELTMNHNGIQSLKFIKHRN
jgi:hypothetical protein